MSSDNSRDMTLELSVFVRKEGDQYASWCPELDIASCGDTMEEACANLDDAIDCYLCSLSEEGDLKRVLEERGLRLSGDKWKCEAPFLSSRHYAIKVPK
jgi:predicted RNase H-like HicB family nuclease